MIVETEGRMINSELTRQLSRKLGDKNGPFRFYKQ